MKTFQFRPYKPSNRYTKTTFQTKCVGVETAIKRFKESNKFNENHTYRMVELRTHAEKDIGVLSSERLVPLNRIGTAPTKEDYFKNNAQPNFK